MYQDNRAETKKMQRESFQKVLSEVNQISLDYFKDKCRDDPGNCGIKEKDAKVNLTISNIDMKEKNL